MLYNKNKWILVAEWYDVDEQEARNRAAEIMIEIFNNRGGQVLEYAAPRERKIGPYGARNVSDWGFYFLFIHMIKDFLMGSFVSVQKYDATKTSVLTNVFQCPFFRSCECVVQWQVSMIVVLWLAFDYLVIAELA